MRRDLTDGLDVTQQPWGFPSSPITISSLPSGTRVAFLARHGAGHTLSPTAVPARANIAALKSLGVRAVLAFSAVGSLREEMPPGTFALVDADHRPYARRTSRELSLTQASSRMLRLAIHLRAGS
jgi:purine nucleoside phosphorylase